MKNPFPPGTRVALAARDHPYHNCSHGVVVYWRGTHSRTQPRVRWSSGWGTSVPAAKLRLLDAAELTQWPDEPQRFDCDFKRDVRAELQRLCKGTS